MASQARKVIVVSFDEAEIAKWSEAELLCVVVSMYESRHRQNSHLEDIREALGENGRPRSAQAITNYMGGSGSIGLAGWSKLYDLTHYEIIPAWIRLKMPFIFEAL